MEGRYLPFIYQISISIGCIRLLRRKQLLIDIDHLLGQCLEFQLIRCQKCLISCIGTITGQCGIQQLLLTSRSRTAVIHGHIACQMHDVRSVLLSTHLNGFGIQTGIGFHGLLVGTVIILKIPVGIGSRGIRGAVKAYIIIHQRDLAVDPLENLLDIVLGQSVLGQRITIQGSGRNIQCHFRYIRLVPDLVLILLQRDRVAGTV